MKTIFLFFCLTLTITIYSQDINCNALTDALPKIEQYKKYKLAVPPTCSEAVVLTYYIFGKFDDEQVFTVMLTDTKHPANEPTLGDVETKFEMAKTSKNKTAIKISRFNLGSKSFVAHDVNTGIKRVYGYFTILKNRYILELRVNSDKILNLDEFQDFIADYISKINESGLAN